MPRIYTSASDPIDYCRSCFPSEKQARAKHDNVGDGPDGRGNCFGYDEDHPPYEGEDYRCDACDVELGAADNDMRSLARRPWPLKPVVDKW